MTMLLQGLFLWLLAGLAVLSFLGSVGLFNAYLALIDGSKRAHLTVWSASVAVFAAFVLFMPRYWYMSPEGDRIILSRTPPSARVQEHPPAPAP